VRSSIGIHGVLSSRRRETRFGYRARPRISETRVTNYIITRRGRRKQQYREKMSRGSASGPMYYNSWKEPRPASNFKTHGANVTHMEFRRDCFISSDEGAIAIRELEVISMSYWTQSSGERAFFSWGTVFIFECSLESSFKATRSIFCSVADKHA